MVASAPSAKGVIVTANDLDFLQRFESCTLPADDWTHLAHIRVAWVVLMSEEGAVAFERIREGILRYNTEVLHRRHKYHETVTVAFARIILDRLRVDEPWQKFKQRINDILAADEPILLAYYSTERLISDEARAEFVQPDIKPLPGTDLDR